MTTAVMRSLDGGYGKPPNQIDWDRICAMIIFALFVAYMFSTGGGQ